MFQLLLLLYAHIIDTIARSEESMLVYALLDTVLIPDSDNDQTGQDGDSKARYR
jgi:hypothetical protein